MGYREGTGYELYEHRSLARPHVFCDGCGRVQRIVAGWAMRSYLTYGHDNYGREVMNTRRHDLCAQCRDRWSCTAASKHWLLAERMTGGKSEVGARLK